MSESLPVVRVSPLRQCVIDDMIVRRFCRATQYVSHPDCRGTGCFRGSTR